MIGEIENKYLISLWQSSLNIDLDVIPAQKLPKIKISDQFFLKGEETDEIYQDSGYPSKNLASLFVAKLLELIGTLAIFMFIYAAVDMAKTHITRKGF